jgi:putative ABC transport system permease protein
MRLSALAYLYGRRLRTHPVQELLAGLGIAVGVALVFAVQVATSSVDESSSQIVHAIVGPADLQLRARSEAGIDEALVRRVSELPGVHKVVRGVEATATARGASKRRVTLQIASADRTPEAAAGIARDPLELLGPAEVIVPRATAEALGVQLDVTPGTPVSLPTIRIQAHGRSYPVKVAAIIGREGGGALSAALATFASLRTVQDVLGLRGRVTNVLVESDRGAHRQVKRELERVAPAGAMVSDADEDVHLLRQATGPNRQASGFFALVAALVGLLLAFNAMLLSVPERRRVVADLRIQGARPRDIVRLLLFQALCLGLAASSAGVVLGDVLSRAMFKETPGYLAAAFPLGTQTVITWQPALIAAAGGVAAACVATLTPVFDLRRSRAVDAVRFTSGEPGQGVSMRIRLVLFSGAVVLMLVSFATPRVLGARAQVEAIVALALATLLSVPVAFALCVSVVQRLASASDRSNLLLLATRTLRATTVRSLALAATGAIAVFGTVAAQGAHRDLLNGLYSDYRQYASSAKLWVANPGDYLATRSFSARTLASRVSGVSGVRAVREYYGGFLDVAGYRAWLIARSPRALGAFPSGQVVAGDRDLLSRRLRAGGWVALSAQLADALHAAPGGRVVLSTPRGAVSYRVAATTTNLGWSAGAIVLNSDDYRRSWPRADPTALEVDLAPGASLIGAQRKISSLLRAGSDLVVESAGERAAHADPVAREGLARLSQISLLLAVRRRLRRLRRWQLRSGSVARPLPRFDCRASAGGSCAPSCCWRQAW